MYYVPNLGNAFFIFLDKPISPHKNTTMTAVVNGIFIALSYPAYTDTPAPIIHDDVSDISSDNDISDISSEESDTTSAADSDSTTSAHADSDITDSDDSAADAAMDDADDEAGYSNAEADSDDEYSDESSDVDFSDNAIDSDAEHADDEREVCHWTVFTENLKGSPERVRDWLLSMKKSRPGTFTKFATLLATRLHDKYPHKAMFVELLY